MHDLTVVNDFPGGITVGVGGTTSLVVTAKAPLESNGGIAWIAFGAFNLPGE